MKFLALHHSSIGSYRGVRSTGFENPAPVAAQDLQVAEKHLGSVYLHYQRTAFGVCALTAAAFLLLPVIAEGHVETGGANGFSSGFVHPLTGLDHIVAMVAVGLWGAFLGAPAIWLLPVIFPLVMALGGALGVLGVPMPGVEIGIALSAIALGLMVALAARPPLWIASVLVGFFAIFHGHAHGTELPESANPLAYAAGFVIATGLLHLGGIAFGLLSQWKAGVVAVRACGGVITLIGLGFLFGFL